MWNLGLDTTYHGKALSFGWKVVFLLQTERPEPVFDYWTLFLIADFLLLKDDRFQSISGCISIDHEWYMQLQKGQTEGPTSFDSNILNAF